MACRAEQYFRLDFIRGVRRGRATTKPSPASENHRKDAREHDDMSSLSPRSVTATAAVYPSKADRQSHFAAPAGTATRGQNVAGYRICRRPKRIKGESSQPAITSFSSGEPHAKQN